MDGVAGVERFELPNDGVRVRSLTAWRHPNVIYLLPIAHTRSFVLPHGAAIAKAPWQGQLDLNQRTLGNQARYLTAPLRDTPGLLNRRSLPKAKIQKSLLHF